MGAKRGDFGYIRPGSQEDEEVELFGEPQPSDEVALAAEGNSRETTRGSSTAHLQKELVSLLALFNFLFLVFVYSCSFPSIFSYLLFFFSFFFSFSFFPGFSLFRSLFLSMFLYLCIYLFLSFSVSFSLSLRCILRKKKGRR